MFTASGNLLKPKAKFTSASAGCLPRPLPLCFILTTLCVMAAMTNVAMERKNDVGLMKAIGGAARRVLRLFLAEAATLGLIAGLIGAAAGTRAFDRARQSCLWRRSAAPADCVSCSCRPDDRGCRCWRVSVAPACRIRPASVFRGEA